MYQSTSSIALSEIRPTAWLARCIVTYASITRPERSRSRRIIEEHAEGDARSRNLLSPAPRFSHLDKPHLCPHRLQQPPCQREQQLHCPGRDRLSFCDRWVAKLVLLPKHQGLSRNGETGC